MENNQNELRPGEAGFRFTRSKQGYSPEEVDAVIDGLAHKNDELTRENERLSGILESCNAKIQRLTQGMQVMDRERQREVLRIADVMTTAGKTAEETVSDARRRSAEIIADAQMTAGQLRERAEVEVKTARHELYCLLEIIGTARESSDRHYRRLDEVLRGAEGMLGSMQPAQDSHHSYAATSAPQAPSAQDSHHGYAGTSATQAHSAQDSHHGYAATSAPQAHSAQDTHHSYATTSAPQANSAQDSHHGYAGTSAPQAPLAQDSHHSYAATSATQAHSAQDTHHSYAATSTPQAHSAQDSGYAATSTDPYADFMKSIGFPPDESKSNQNPHGKIIGHFGN